MVETARYSQIMLEDLALGVGTRNVRLADGGVYALTEVHVTGFLLRSLFRLRATDFSGTALMTGTSRLPADSRVWGVTAKVTTAFGVTGGLTGLRIGDAADTTRWTSSAMALTLNTETNEGDFSDASLMIYNAAANLLVSGVGGTFDADGVLELCVFYSQLRHPQ